MIARYVIFVHPPSSSAAIFDLYVWAKGIVRVVVDVFFFFLFFRSVNSGGIEKRSSMGFRVVCMQRLRDLLDRAFSVSTGFVCRGGL